MTGLIEIEAHAFFDCKALSELDFDKLEIIGNYAFFCCRSLRSINMPSIRRVGRSAFNGCDALTDAVFGKDLERIEEYAFYNSRALRSISIPLKHDLIISNNAFSSCFNLSRIDALVGGIHKTILSLHMESWRVEMKDEIDSINQTLPNTPEKTTAIQQWIIRVFSRMDHYKTEHKVLVKEAMTLLELALWKANLDDNEAGVPSQEGVRVTRRQVKRARKERCITSGAGIIIKNVLPFLDLELDE